MVRRSGLQKSSSEEDAATVVGVLEKDYANVLSNYCSFDLNGRGKLIPGVFDGAPTLKKKERTAFKKLSDEEEARQRKIEMAEAMKKRDADGGGAAADAMKNKFEGADASENAGASSQQSDRAKLKALLEQKGGGETAKKVKKEIVAHSPKSKALRKRGKEGTRIVLGAGKDGGGVVKEEEVVKKPVNPMLAALGGGSGGIPRPPNPMLAAIQARAGGDETKKKKPPPIPKGGPAAGNPPRPPPMGGMFAEIAKIRID